MPSRLQESLKEKVQCRLRSSTNLTSRDVLIHMSEKLNDETLKNEKVLKLEIVAPQKDEGDPASVTTPKEGKKEKKEAVVKQMITLRLGDITDVKVKNFVEKMVNVFVVSISCGNVQHFLEFETADKRDDWGNGLRSLHHAHQWANKRTEAKTDSRKLHLIKTIQLELPRPGCIISMNIETAGGRKAELDVADREDKYDSAQCKELTHDFILQNFIVPAEGASLYRFIRSVLSRLLMERETNAILGEIEAFRYNKVTEAPGHHGAVPASQIRMLLHTADEKLRDLAGVVPDRIGRHGPSSQLLVDILLRTIEKTKIYNRMAFAVNFGQQGEDVEF